MSHITNATRNGCHQSMRKRIVVIAEYFPSKLDVDRRGFEILKRLTHKWGTHFIAPPLFYVLFIRKIETVSREVKE